MHLPLRGIQAASSVFNAGKVVPSPTPSRMRRAISHGAPPQLITIGVSKVKIAVDKIPKLSVYLPPYLAERTPPGTWVTAWRSVNRKLRMNFLINSHNPSRTLRGWFPAGSATSRNLPWHRVRPALDPGKCRLWFSRQLHSGEPSRWSLCSARFALCTLKIIKVSWRVCLLNFVRLTVNNCQKPHESEDDSGGNITQTYGKKKRRVLTSCLQLVGLFITYTAQDAARRDSPLSHLTWSFYSLEIHFKIYTTWPKCWLELGWNLLFEFFFKKLTEASNLWQTSYQIFSDNCHEKFTTPAPHFLSPTNFLERTSDELFTRYLLRTAQAHTKTEQS